MYPVRVATSPYRYVKRTGHPLIPPGGGIRLPEHRVILYEKIGPGAHPCHWCGKSVEWIPGGRTKPGSLIADHVDGDPSDNDPENLVPSCQGCNIHRNSERKLDGKLTLTDSNGKRHLAVERICGTCGGPFLIRASMVKSQAKKRAGTYCSRACLHGRPNWHR